MQSHTANLGGPVHYVDHGGEGTPLVLVHGLGGSLLNWAAVGRRLTAHGRVLALDLAGFGRTPLAGRSASVDANGRLLERFLREVVGAPAVLMGNSMGGFLSLRVAARAPELARALVLVNPAQPHVKGVPLDPEVARRFAIAAVPGLGELMAAFNARRLGARRLTQDMLELCCKDTGTVPLEVVEAHVALTTERLATMPWGSAAYLEAARSLLRTLRRADGYHRDVKAVRCPTMLVHGVHDRLVRFACSEALARLRPDWRFEVFPDAGHVPQLEDPDGFCSRVGTWLDGLGQEQRSVG
ncbi:alpha/beta hydrolase [Pyxidicoccus fallax]|uniref:Alpha/beta hydrolase n=1 Tax=Pyxidicoccus fallax TaxID=394095 RepID=A0A848LET8_9BACT|nr:alpha/beta hydrolase [Pyxidicoccus fallax]NMO16924.1 alpha/beta hydrolase [Pyxidicoccus fallax]NPC84162.1 alpha/beta hydrolase [Pyxidicoccus fallax]